MRDRWTGVRWGAALGCFVLVVACIACNESPPAPTRVEPRRPDDPVTLATELAAPEPALATLLTPQEDAFAGGDEITSVGWRSGLPAGVGARLPMHSDGAIDVAIGRSEAERITLHAIGASSANALIDRGRVTYASIYPSVDAVWTAGARRIELFYILRDANAPRELAWSVVRAEHIGAIEPDVDGGVIVRDEAGHATLHIPRPFALDAKGTRRDATLTFDAETDRLALTLDTKGLVFPVLLDPAIETAQWSEVATSGPAKRWATALAFDSVQNKVILFGGIFQGLVFDDTWEWSGSAWTQVTPTTRPPRTMSHTLVFDRRRRRSFLFGGTTGFPMADTNALWEYTGTTWNHLCTTNPCAATQPPARANHGATYDTNRRRMVVFGGLARPGTFLNDTWEFNGVRWINACTSAACVASAPSPRSNFAMAYDAARGLTVLFGGGNASTPRLGDTYEWDGSTWTKRVTAPSPPARTNHTMAYDIPRKKIVLTGGTGFIGNDTWEWDGVAWAQTTAFPVARVDFAASASAPSPNDILLFGGVSGATALDTWGYRVNGGACTANNQCSSGFCVDGVCCNNRCGGGSLVDCLACSVAAGAAQDGVCTPAAPGTGCSDRNACTQRDVCLGNGVCSGAPITCTPSDACHRAGTCNPSTGRCNAGPALPNGSPCSDGNQCTTSDSCQGGACIGTVAPNGTACTDGDACTQSDTCQGGACSSGSAVVCNASDSCHVAGTCDPATGTCSNPIAPDGTACSDGDACTQSDRCVGGACSGTNPVVCTSADPCHVAGACDPATGTCSNPAAPDGTTCSDGDLCTTVDRCQGGACLGAPVICAATDACHVAGTCNPTTGTCSNPSAPDGTACSDGNACTRTDSCVGGACVGASPVVCSPSDACHVAGVCDPSTGACSNPNARDGTMCNDGDACTQTDFCTAGSCLGGNPVVCTRIDACHLAGVCDPANGVCSNPSAPDGSRCNDGDACTVADACVAGVCNPGTSVSCDTTAWAPVASMAVARGDHQGVSLANGDVLVVGGSNNGPFLAEAELFSAATSIWQSAGSLHLPRSSPTVIVLPNERVLVAAGDNGTTTEILDLGVAGSGTSSSSSSSGGTSSSSSGGTSSSSGGTGVSGNWLFGPLMNRGHQGALGALLPSGAAMVVDRDATEILDPTTNTWSLLPGTVGAGLASAIVTLADGRILVAGGRGSDNVSSSPLASIFSPQTNSWTPIAPMNIGREQHGLVALTDGRVLAIGGLCRGLHGTTACEGQASTPLASVEMYSPATNTWSFVSPLPSKQQAIRAALLPNGRVIELRGDGNATNAASIYDPSRDTWSSLPSPQGRAVLPTLNLLPSGRALLAGGFDFTATNSAQILTLPDPCRVGACDPANGQCSTTILPDGTACDDGNPNTSGDVCANGVCSGLVGAGACGDGVVQAASATPSQITFSWLAGSNDASTVTFKINGSVAATSTIPAGTVVCDPGIRQVAVTDPTILASVQRGRNVFEVEISQNPQNTIVAAWALATVDWSNGRPSQDVVVFDQLGGGDAAARNASLCGSTYQTNPPPQQVAVELGESCDDGNTTSGDGCSATCRRENRCGDGVVQDHSAIASLEYVWLAGSNAQSAATFRVNGVAAATTTANTAGTYVCNPGIRSFTVTDPMALSLIHAGSNVFGMELTDGATPGIVLAWAVVRVHWKDGRPPQEIVIFDHLGGGNAEAHNADLCGSSFERQSPPHAVVAIVGESCDDGNATSGDGCSAACQPEAGCGDAVVQDQTSASYLEYVWLAASTSESHVTFHVNGAVATTAIANTAGTFACDAGIRSTSVTDPSVLALLHAGTNVFDADFAETITDGLVVAWALVRVHFKDGRPPQEIVIFDAGDGGDAAARNADACRATNESRPPKHAVAAKVGESCDDGNATNGDGCSGTCRGETRCGDGVIQNQSAATSIEYIWLSGSNDTSQVTFRVNGSVAATAIANVAFTYQCSPGIRSTSVAEPSVLALLQGANTFEASFSGTGVIVSWVVARVHFDDGRPPQEIVMFDQGGGGDAQARNADLCGAGFQTSPPVFSLSSSVGEGCDDGNIIGGDGCSAVCQPE